MVIQMGSVNPTCQMINMTYHVQRSLLRNKTKLFKNRALQSCTNKTTLSQIPALIISTNSRAHILKSILLWKLVYNHRTSRNDTRPMSPEIHQALHEQQRHTTKALRLQPGAETINNNKDLLIGVVIVEYTALILPEGGGRITCDQPIGIFN